MLLPKRWRLGSPILSSRISGMIGLLGEDYPGYFPVADTDRLTELLVQAEQDRDFYRELQVSCRRVRHLVTPRREKRLWKELLAEITLKQVLSFKEFF